MTRIRHIEIAGTNGERLRRFYEDLFGWKIVRREIVGFDYYDVETSGDPTVGIRNEPEGSAEIVIYVEVDDLHAAVEEAEKLGAVVRIPEMRHGDLEFTLIVDTEGNPIGMNQAPSGD